MSEGGGEPVKNGVVEAPIQENGNAPPQVKCPEVNFSPYDEHGRPKPFVAICPPKLPVPGDQQQLEEQSSNGPDKPSSVESKEVTQEETKEQDDAKPSSSPAPASPAPASPAPSSPAHASPAHASPAPSSPAPTSPAHTSPAPGSPAPSAEPPGSPSATDSKKSFSEQFKLFSKFGDIKSDGRLLSLSQSDKWMKQAKVIDGKHITTTDTGIHFKKHKSIKLSETDYKKFLEELAKSKKMNCGDIKKKMIGCGPPGFTSSASAKTPGAFERLTDTSKYTGSHKQRFDETGKGRGIAGRKDLHDTSGYVSGYNNKNTYDKKNPTK